MVKSFSDIVALAVLVVAIISIVSFAAWISVIVLIFVVFLISIFLDVVYYIYTGDFSEIAKSFYQIVNIEPLEILYNKLPERELVVGLESDVVGYIDILLKRIIFSYKNNEFIVDFAVFIILFYSISEGSMNSKSKYIFVFIILTVFAYFDRIIKELYGYGFVSSFYKVTSKSIYNVIYFFTEEEFDFLLNLNDSFVLIFAISVFLIWFGNRLVKLICVFVVTVLVSYESASYMMELLGGLDSKYYRLIQFVMPMAVTLPFITILWSFRENDRNSEFDRKKSEIDLKRQEIAYKEKELVIRNKGIALKEKENDAREREYKERKKDNAN